MVVVRQILLPFFLLLVTYIARGNDLRPRNRDRVSQTSQEPVLEEERMILPFDHVDGSAMTREQGRHCEESKTPSQFTAINMNKMGGGM